MQTKIIEIPEDDLRKIHSRLDVHKQAIERLAEACVKDTGMHWKYQDEILAMLEESQNPFEVKDE